MTVSANTTPELFEAARQLNVVSYDERTTHADGFMPSYNYDSAIAVVNQRVVGGIVARRSAACYLRKILADDYHTMLSDGRVGPTVWDLWVHPAHRRQGLGRQLLEAIAGHFGRKVTEMGHRLPITEAAAGALRSMGIVDVLGCN